MQKFHCDICDDEIESEDSNNPIEIPHPLFGKDNNKVTREKLFVRITIGFKKNTPEAMFELCHRCWRKMARTAAQAIPDKPTKVDDE